MEWKENIMEIITRHLNREASQSEESVLASWLKESPAHQQEYNDYVKLWEDSAGIVLKHHFNTAAAWDKIQKKTQALPDVIPFKRGTVFSLKRMAAAAAIIIFITAAAVYLFNANKETSGQMISALQNNQRVSLPDGSVVTLRKGSTLRYPDNFGDEDRFVELTGEAIFEVERNEQKPFRVTTSNAVVEVLGTSFLVRNTDSLDQVVVSTGKVSFAERKNIANKVILTKGQKAKLINNQLIRDTVLNTNDMAWQSGKLTFNNTALRQVIEDISHLYNVEIRLAPEVEKNADNITIKAEFKKEPLEQVLDEIELMTGLKIVRENSAFVIRH